MARTTIRNTKSGTRITSRIKAGNNRTITTTWGGSKKPRVTTTTRTKNMTYTTVRQSND
jgi:hypothetical protein